jgi:hypothetical protein
MHPGCCRSSLLEEPEVSPVDPESASPAQARRWEPPVRDESADRPRVTSQNLCRFDGAQPLMVLVHKALLVGLPAKVGAA